jgi:hypothetical protein
MSMGNDIFFNDGSRLPANRLGVQIYSIRSGETQRRDMGGFAAAYNSTYTFDTGVINNSDSIFIVVTGLNYNTVVGSWVESKELPVTIGSVLKAGYPTINNVTLAY